MCANTNGSSDMTESTPPTPDRLMQFVWGYAPPLILHTALELDIFDLLHSAPATLEDLARRTQASTRGLRAILNALVGLEFLTRAGDRYSLTPESSAFLVSSSPSYHGGLIRHGVVQLLPQWMQLGRAARTGQPVASTDDEHAGARYFAEFVESLFATSRQAAVALGQHLRISEAQGPVSVLDLGAGSGVWGISLAEQSPQVTVHAVDWPAVLDITMKVAGRHGVQDRFRPLPGDLLTVDFGSATHQVATIGHILHGLGPDRSRQLLRKTRDALAPGGTIAISEFIPRDDRTGPARALVFAVNMLVHTDTGDTFTFAEMKDWLLEAGFADPQLLDVPAPSPLVLATKR
jgi:3-hydroxy-5-methyl-1-naphthoate 3-O-methyltransferase